MEINGLGERMLIPPFGLEGGHPGACSGVHVKQANSTEWKTVAEAFDAVSPSKFNGYKAHEGDAFRITSGGGGGYGDPLDRPPAEVVEDVASGYVSRDAARDAYGVVIVDGKDGEVAFDAQATEALRGRLGVTPAHMRHGYDRILKSALARAVRGEPDQRTRAEIDRVEDIVRRARAHIARAGIADPASPGASLDNPFLNERAVQYWDSYSLERWMARHGFTIEDG